MGIPRKEDRRGDGMGEFNVGAARIAYKNKVPMIPVRLEGVDKIMPPGKFFKTYGKMKVSFGEPVDTLSGEYGNNKSDRYRNLTDCVRERVVGLGG
jgi:1-acyl-sn-glycerol-3-phosphate acyltransferase